MGLYELERLSPDVIRFSDSATWNRLVLKVWVLPNTRRPIGFELTNEADSTILTNRNDDFSYASYNDEKSHFIESTPLITQP